jgi:hypothetical protein
MSNGQLNEVQSTFWSEEHLASPSASPGFDKDSATPEVDSCLRTLRSLNVCNLDGLSGKTSPASCHPTEDGTLVPSSGRWGNWGMGGPTGSWTLNGAEHTGTHAPSRSAGEGCLSLVASLSEVLETQPLPQRFSLSAKACSGILRRAERRGKDLPPMLKQALEQVAGGTARTAQAP